MKNILVWIVGVIVLVVILVSLVGMYKFNYLAGEQGYDVDGNKITNTQEYKDVTQEEKECIGEFCNGEQAEASVAETTINVPLVYDDQTGTGSFGCGVEIVPMPYEVPRTVGVLDASYRMLFSLPYESLPEYRNTIASYEDLQYESVTIVDGVAKLNLRGTMYGPGHCAQPELRRQISQTALQFPSVATIEVYLNGELYDWCELDDSDGEGGCDETPMYWIDSE